MTPKEKLIELFAISYYKEPNIINEPLESQKLLDYLIGETFSDTIKNRYDLTEFIGGSGIKVGKPDINYSYTLNKHNYNIKGLLKLTLLAILYNWKELFERLVEEYNILAKKYGITTVFSKDDLKGIGEILIKELSNLLETTTIATENYRDLVMPFRLN